jgi:hypothetical protein
MSWRGRKKGASEMSDLSQIDTKLSHFTINNKIDILKWGPSWPWLYGSWIYNYLCNQYLSPLMLWVWISIRARCTTLCDKVCQWLATGQWFSPGPPVSSTNKTDRHDITEILLKVVLNTIKQTNKHCKMFHIYHRTYSGSWHWLSLLPFLLVVFIVRLDFL